MGFAGLIYMKCVISETFLSLSCGSSTVQACMEGENYLLPRRGETPTHDFLCRPPMPSSVSATMMLSSSVPSCSFGDGGGMSNCFRSTAGYRTVGLTPFLRRRRNVWLNTAAVKELLTRRRSALPGREERGRTDSACFHLAWTTRSSP